MDILSALLIVSFAIAVVINLSSMVVRSSPETLINARATAISDIAGLGAIYIEKTGELTFARSADGHPIPEGSKVTVICACESHFIVSDAIPRWYHRI